MLPQVRSVVATAHTALDKLHARAAEAPEAHAHHMSSEVGPSR